MPERGWNWDSLGHRLPSSVFLQVVDIVLAEDEDIQDAAKWSETSTRLFIVKSTYSLEVGGREMEAWPV